jgi:HAD superfamily hydrolase (TIGR01509 family)
MTAHTELQRIAFRTGRPAAIVLDMDGLLLDTERLVRTAWQGAAADVGCVMDDALYAELLGRTDEEAIRYLTEVYGASFDAATFSARAHARTADTLERNAVPMRPGAAMLLTWMQAVGVPRAIATSTATEHARSRLERSGIWGRIPFVIGGDQVQRSKPAPDIYLHAAAALGVPPTQCLALEDSSSGACAAASAGMTTIIVPDLCGPTDVARAACSAVVESLEDVAAWLQEIWKREQ